MPKSVSLNTNRVLNAWICVADRNVSLDSHGVSELMIETLKCIQSMSHSDLCIISAIDGSSPWTLGQVDVDPDLLRTTGTMIQRSLEIYGESVSLNDLLDTYVQLFSISSSKVDYVPIRSSVGQFLISRIGSGEQLPLSFDMCKFVDTFIADLTIAHAVNLSDWALHRVKWIRARGVPYHSQKLIDQLLAVQRVWGTLGTEPHADFIEAVKIYVSY